MLKILETHEIVGVVAFFMIVQFLGLLIAFMVGFTGSQTAVISRLLSPQAVDISYAVDALLFFIIMLLILNRHKKHNAEIWNHRFFKFFEVIVLTGTSFFAFLFFLTTILPASLPSFYFVALGCAIIVVASREQTRRARNTATAVSSIGVGLILGFYFSFKYTLIILAALSVYDYLSVFVTKTMIKLASTLTNEDVAFLISEEDLEAIPAQNVSIGEISEYTKELKETHQDQDPVYKEVLNKGDLPVLSQIQLGEGDLGLPLMAVVSAYFTFHSTFIPIVIAVAAVIGLLITILFLKRYRRPLPAIPPLFSLISIFAGVVLWHFGYATAYQAGALVGIGIVVVTLGMGMQLWRKKKAEAQMRVALEKRKAKRPRTK